MTILQTNSLKKYYGSGDNLVKALDGASLQIEEGELRLSQAVPVPSKAPYCICLAVWIIRLPVR